MSRQLNFGRRLGLLHRLIANESRFRLRHSFSALPARSGVGRIFRFAVSTAHVHGRGLIKLPAGAKSSATEKFGRCLGLSDSYLSLFAAFCGIFSSGVSFRASGQAPAHRSKVLGPAFGGKEKFDACVSMLRENR